MKLTDFRPMLLRPGLYEADWNRLQSVDLDVMVDGVRTSVKYEDVRARVLEEGVVEASWSAVASLKTKKHEYRREFNAQSSEAAWQMLCLDVHLAARRDSNIGEVTWFAFEGNRTDDGQSSASLFAVLGQEIVEPSFTIGSHEASQGPLNVLIDSLGVWREVALEKTRQLWRNDLAWKVGWARACYEKFYLHTDIGRAYALAPQTRRFDEAHYWYEDAPAQATMSDVAKRVDTLADGLRSLRLLVAFAVVAAAAIGVAGWLWR